jgi:choline dehydrogenase-like flavoprotein
MGGSLHCGRRASRHVETGQIDIRRTGRRLEGTKRVFVADAAVFPALPAKNLTFTIMANAMRVASGIRGRLE